MLSLLLTAAVRSGEITTAEIGETPRSSFRRCGGLACMLEESN